MNKLFVYFCTIPNNTNKMKQVTLTTLLLTFFLSSFSQKTYKPMMNDLSINFYDVCKEADKYFVTHDKNVKGSGWKGYQRWRVANEYKFYPDGDRSQIDPFFAENAYKTFINNNPSTKSLFNNGWQELGPFTIDSLTGHYSPGLGRIEEQYIDPSNANIIYVGSRSGGFWKTTNGGTNWQGTTDYLIASGVNAIAVSPTNSDSILINIRNSRNGYSHGIYRSVDGGNTWIESNFNPINLGEGGLGSNFQIFKIAYHPTVANLVFVGTSKGIYRSDDNLSTWTAHITNGDITEIDFHPTNPNIIYTYDNYAFGPNEDYVMRSVDMGFNFTQSNQIAGNSDLTGQLSVSASCPDCLYFASANGVWKSTNNGMDFTFLSNPSQTCQGFAVNDLDDANMIYGYVDIEATTDGGATFNQVTSWTLGNAMHGIGTNNEKFHNTTKYVHADLRTAKCVNGIFYVGTDGFIAKSVDNGINWEVIGQGIAVKEFYKLGVSQSNHYRTIVGAQDNGETIQYKGAWLDFYGADGMEGLIHPLNDQWIVGSVQYGSRRRTKNGGASQGGVSPAGQSGSGNAAWEAPITYDPNNHMTIYNFSKQIYKSEDFGDNWNLTGSPSTFTGSINQSAIAENNSDIIVITNGSNIEKSTNGGTSFSSIKNSLPNYSIEDLAFDPSNDDIIIVVYARYQSDNQKVYRTDDGGNTWSNITYNLGNMPIRSVVIDHTDASNIYLGAEIGVYTKPMNSNTWTLYNTNLPNCTVEELEIVYGSNTLKAATWGRGLWEYSLVGRNDFPAIVSTKITDAPTSNAPLENFEQYVSSEIAYDHTIANVFVKWSKHNPTFGNTINMTYSADSTWISDNPLPDDTAGTKIYFKVFAVGNNLDTSETYKFMYTIKPFVYCDASGSMNYQGNVTLVDLYDINSPSGKTQAYTDYSNTDSTELIQGQSYDITVNLNTDNGNYKYYAKTWIDWNRNTTFEDEEAYELGFSENVVNGITSLSPFTILVPEDAQIGEVKMRVICQYNNYPNACDSGIDGEVEDYKIIILQRPDLSYTFSDNYFCSLDEKITFNYTGEVMDSIKWTLTNGSVVYQSNSFTDVLVISQTGDYTLNMVCYKGDQKYIKTVSNTLRVNNLNATVQLSSFSILANPTGLVYTWLDCDNQFAVISGETSQIFNATLDGRYAVDVYDGLCSDTSECVQVTGVGIVENSFQSDINLYPNPTNQYITVTFSKLYPQLKYILNNDIGQLIKTEDISNQQKINIDLLDNNKGIYTLHIVSQEKQVIFKIIKN
jgi:photosystem II stability/assembly factor-like uncharacterized protein